VLALAARQGHGGRLERFSLGFNAPGYDERPYARAVAQRFGATHHEVIFDAAEAGSLLEKGGDLFDEPLVDGSYLPTYALSRLAREHVTVTLGGDGGDELFCGYPTFLAERWLPALDRAPAALVPALSRVIERWPRSSGYAGIDVLLKQLCRGLPHPRSVRTQVLLGGLTPAERAGLLSRDVRAACAAREPYDLIGAALGGLGKAEPLEQAIYQHCKFYLAGQNLPNVDRASMAVGLEVRAPFLDHAMVELAGRIPASLKLRGLTMKYILKRALRDLLVAAVAALLVLPPLGQRVLVPSDEVRFVLYARDVAERGAPFDVRVRAKLFREKPPLFAWLIALSSAPVGRVTEATAQLPVALAAIAAVVFTFLAGDRLLGRGPGVMGGLALATTYGFFSHSQFILPDMLVVACVCAAMYALVVWQRAERVTWPAPVAFYVAFAGAVYAKGP